MMNMLPEGTEACPYCGTHESIPIVYGLPGPEMLEASEAGEIVLGGCVVLPAGATRHCRACGRDWRHVDLVEFETPVGTGDRYA